MLPQKLSGNGNKAISFCLHFDTWPPNVNPTIILPINNNIGMKLVGRKILHKNSHKNFKIMLDTYQKPQACHETF